MVKVSPKFTRKIHPQTNCKGGLSVIEPHKITHLECVFKPGVYHPKCAWFLKIALSGKSVCVCVVCACVCVCALRPLITSGIIR